MPRDQVDSETAAYASGVSVRTVQYAVRDGRLENYGSPRRVRVSLAEVLSVLGDPMELSP